MNTIVGHGLGGRKWSWENDQLLHLPVVHIDAAVAQQAQAKLCGGKNASQYLTISKSKSVALFPNQV